MADQECRLIGIKLPSAERAVCRIEAAEVGETAAHLLGAVGALPRVGSEAPGLLGSIQRYPCSHLAQRAVIGPTWWGRGSVFPRQWCGLVGRAVVKP